MFVLLSILRWDEALEVPGCLDPLWLLGTGIELTHTGHEDKEEKETKRSQMGQGHVRWGRDPEMQGHQMVCSVHFLTEQLQDSSLLLLNILLE